MIALAHTLQVFICTKPTDMRCSFDSLCGMAENLMKQDPMSGHLFVFRNRNRDRLKILYWDRDGLAIWYKKHESHYPGRFLCTRNSEFVQNIDYWANSPRCVA
jgi:transposase